MSSNNNNNNNSYIASYKERKKERTKTLGNRVNGESYEKLKDILRRERKEVGDWLEDCIENYIKKHGDGNPIFTLDHYNDENFLATPAFHRPKQAWESYLTKCSDKHYKEWVAQLEFFMNLERRMTKLR